MAFPVNTYGCNMFYLEYFCAGGSKAVPILVIAISEHITVHS